MFQLIMLHWDGEVLHILHGIKTGFWVCQMFIDDIMNEECFHYISCEKGFGKTFVEKRHYNNLKSSQPYTYM